MRNHTDQEGIVTVRYRRNQNRRNQQIASPPNYWLKLPREIIITILQKVGVLHILLSAQLVCTHWREICTDTSMWATIRVVDWLPYRTPKRNFAYDKYLYRTHVINMIRWAVDQSCCSLFDLDLDNYTSEEMLYYVVERCNRIRRIRLVSKFSIDDLLERVTSRLPLLEDFELIVGYPKLSLRTIENLGRYCPKLSSLKIHVHGDEEAKIIARNMPQLRHICLSGKSFVTYMGVEALLDGCPHLEYLDIRECYFFEITRAFQMMKNLPLTRTQWRDELDDPCISSTVWVDRWVFNAGQKCDVKYIIRRAVDTSCGGLVDLNLDEYMSGDILDYIIERCTRIRRLHGYMQLDCSEEAVRAALARLPLLEDLSLHRGDILSAETMETVVRCCPRLTSLGIPIDNNGAKTLAALTRSLPRLRHLKLFYANKLLTYVGVEALLDGCPHLTSLDLQKCNGGDYAILWIRYAQKIKYFRRPDAKYYLYYCGSTEYRMVEDDLEDTQFLEEDDVYDVDYTIRRGQEYWIRREKSRSKETHTQQLRRAKGNKNRPKSDARESKARRIKEFRIDSRREVKKEFVHWNKVVSDHCTVKKMVLGSFAG